MLLTFDWAIDSYAQKKRISLSKFSLSFKSMFFWPIKVLLKSPKLNMMELIKISFILATSILPFAFFPICEPFFLNNLKHSPEVVNGDWGLPFSIICLGINFLSLFVFNQKSRNKIRKMFGPEVLSLSVSNLFLLILFILGIMISYGSGSFHNIVIKQSGYYFGFLPQWGIVKLPGFGLVFCVLMIFSSNWQTLYWGERNLKTDVFLNQIGNGRMALVEYLFLSNIRICYTLIFVFVFFGGYQQFFVFNPLVEAVPSLLYITQALSVLIKFITVWVFINVSSKSFARLSEKTVVKILLNRLVPISICNIIILLVWRLKWS